MVNGYFGMKPKSTISIARSQYIYLCTTQMGVREIEREREGCHAQSTKKSFVPPTETWTNLPQNVNCFGYHPPQIWKSGQITTLCDGAG